MALENTEFNFEPKYIFILENVLHLKYHAQNGGHFVAASIENKTIIKQ